MKNGVECQDNITSRYKGSS